MKNEKKWVKFYLSSLTAIGLIVLSFFLYLSLTSLRGGVTNNSFIYFGQNKKIAINRIKAFRIDSRKTYVQRMVGCDSSLFLIIEDKKEIEVDDVFVHDPKFIYYLKNNLKLPQQSSKRFEC
jgi:hypothetical protein